MGIQIERLSLKKISIRAKLEKKSDVKAIFKVGRSLKIIICWVITWRGFVIRDRYTLAQIANPREGFKLTPNR